MNLKPSKSRVFAIMMIVSVVLMMLGPGATGSMRNFAQMLIAPIGDGGMYVVSALKPVSNSGGISPTDALQLRHENDQLRLQLVEAQHRLALQNAEHRREMLDVQEIRTSAFSPREDNPCELIPARVVAGDALPYGKWRVVNRGSDDMEGSPVLSRLLITDRSKSIPRNLAVITSSALVGTVAESGAFTSRIQLVGDKGFHIRGRIIRHVDPAKPRLIMSNRPGAAGVVTLDETNNRLEVLAHGDGVSGLIIEAVAECEKVMPGDWLVTSDAEPHLRTEVRIGVVQEVIVNPADRRFVTVKVKPFVDPATLRDVYIVYWKPPL
ncbi:MAG: rod shape-determining protein MreC [Planctomycetes bacterium]|nr:rod shape-determining protein MreC [Planctomycetota bacterium]